MTTIGYARVSTPDQSLDMQLDALDAAGCIRIYTDTASGALDSRPGLADALDAVAAGDTLVVWRLDRLGRSLAHLVTTVDGLGARDVALRSLHEQIDTRSATGRLTLGIFASLAEFERELTAERTAAGLAAAKRREAPRDAAGPAERVERRKGRRCAGHACQRGERGRGGSGARCIARNSLPARVANVVAPRCWWQTGW